jgi:hypothetical protein
VLISDTRNLILMMMMVFVVIKKKTDDDDDNDDDDSDNSGFNFDIPTFDVQMANTLGLSLD